MKRYLVTGASGGLGIQIAEKLLEEGDFLYLIANKNSNKLDSIKENYSKRVEIIPIDFLSEFDFISFAGKFDQLDGIIHCLGIPSAGMSWKISPEEWDKVMQLNLRVPFLLSSAFIPIFRKNNFGRILFFSSVVAQKGIVGTSAYSASKSALIGLTKTMSVELIKNNITVNCISPGYMDAGMINAVDSEYLEQILNLIPSNKLGEAKNIVHTVSFLLSEQANYITGQVINVNGGMV
jgi:3-oxoacyl-[acyl-carrier protein] reductase